MSFAEMYASAPEPKTPLGRLRILSPHAGVRMSPLQFGGIALGSGWADYTGTAKTEEESFTLLDDFVAAGGASIDTSNLHSNNESEILLAPKLGKTGAANSTGNHKKSLHISLRESLKKLQTDYIDILYIHWLDHTTSVEELMDSLDLVVKSGKVLYLGISDFPAWFVAACQTYAKMANKTPFVILQTRWNVIDRDVERELLPMARNFGLAIAPWGVMAEGRLLSRKQLEELKASGNFRKGLDGDDQTEDEMKYSEVLAKIGAKRGIDSVPPVALAYLFAKYPYWFPVVGVQTAEQIHDNARAMEIDLTVEEIKEIEAVKPLDYGFPNTMVDRDPCVTGRATGGPGTRLGTIDWLVDKRVYSSRLPESEKHV